MAQRNRRRNPPRQAKPGTAVAVKPKVEVAQVVHQPPVFVSTYGEPAAERILTSFEQYVELAYGGNSVIFGLLNVQMRLFSEARLCWRDLGDRKLSYDPGEQLEKLRNPWPNGFTGDMLARMRQDAAIAGNAYVRDCGDRLERLRPDWVTIVSWVTEDALGRQVREVIGFMYEPTGDPERAPDWYPVEEVAHWAPIPDPLANFRGMSWFTPALREINADRAMTEHREKFWRNAATPNIIIKYSGKITPSQKIGLAESIAAKHGGPDKAGGTLVLDEGADPMIVGAKLSDAQFSEVLSQTENRMAVAAGVPALLAGLKEGLDAAAWSMYRQAMRAFADMFVRPDWRSACAALSVLVTVPDGRELWYDTRDIAALQEGEAEQASRLQIEATTINSLITAGFTAESSVKTVSSGDITQLVHTGLVSVQLNKPGEKEEPEPENPDGPDSADDADGGKPDDVSDEDEKSDVDRALVVALTDELARSRGSNEKVLGWALGQLELQRGWTRDTFDESRVDRDKASGRFGKGLGAVAKALLGGADDALEGFNREQLRREARRRGIELPRGAHIDVIKDALWEHEGPDSGLPAPEPAAGDIGDMSTADLRKQVKAMGVPTTGMRRDDLIYTMRLQRFAEKQGLDMNQGPFGGKSNVEIRQLHQEHIDHIRGVGDAVRDVADVAAKGGDVGLAAQRVRAAAAVARNDGRETLADVLDRLGERVGEADSIGEALTLARRVLEEAGGELVDGDEMHVDYSPDLHQSGFAQRLKTGERVLVVRPGVRDPDTGVLLAKAEVFREGKQKLPPLDDAPVPEPSVRTVEQMIADPKPEDRAAMRGMFKSLTVKQLADVAAKHGAELSDGNKDTKAGRLVESLIGYKLNSLAVRQGSWGNRQQTAEDDKPSVQTQISDVYERLVTDRDAGVRLSALRDQLPGLSREQLDAALLDLDRRRLIYLVPEAKQSSLTQDDRDAAIELGGEAKQVIKFAPPRPANPERAATPPSGRRFGPPTTQESPVTAAEEFALRPAESPVGKPALADVVAMLKLKSADPRPGDRELVDGLLKGLTVAQMRNLAAEFAITTAGTSKADLRRDLVHGLVGAALNRLSIMNVSMRDESDTRRSGDILAHGDPDEHSKEPRDG